MRRLLVATAILGALGVGAALWNDATRAWGNLLVVTFYFLSLALGALFFLALKHLTSAAWWVAWRRIPETIVGFLPVAAVLLLTTFLGRHHLYHWTHPEAMAGDALLAGKAAYLNPTAFFLRMVIFLGLWVAFAHRMRRLSFARTLDTAEADRRLKRCSAFFVVTFAVTFSLASFDWLMSLEPHWFSTIFAVYTFAGMFVGSLAAMTLAALLLRRSPALVHRIRTEHLHDLGKLLFAFSTFWAYIWLSQYLLIWYSNLPEEIPHYLARTQGVLGGLFFLNLALNWAVPFLVLMPRATKRRPMVLGSVAGMLLLSRWLDLYLQVMPALGEPPRLGLAEIAPLLGCGALFALFIRRRLAAAPPVPREHPFLKQSLMYRS